jgi:Flp pilus assembly protein TadD
MNEHSSNPLVFGQRLDSWKEIAAFLGKGERTVKRWEQERGLPVRRVPGKGKGSVYAFSGELNDWLKSQSAQNVLSGAEEGYAERALRITSADSVANLLEAQRAAAPLIDEPRRASPNRIWWAAAFIVVLAVVCVALVRQLRTPTATSVSGNLRPARHLANPEANSLYLKGRFEWSKRTPESLPRALDYFTQAIVQDPSDAQAYAGLADTYSLLREYTNMPDAEAFPRALAAARKAVQLDDSLAEAHRALAFDLFNWSWDFAGAEREFRRAIALNPQDAASHHWFATSLMVLGRFPESITEIQRARELDPSSNTILADEAVILYYAHRGADSKSLLKQVEEADPAFLAPHRYLAFMAYQTADYAAYVEESEKAAQLSHDRAAIEVAAAARAGYERGGAAKMLDAIYRIEKQDYEQKGTSAVALAETCVLLGKEDEAVGYLEADFSTHDANLLSLRMNPVFGPLGSNARFRALEARMNLPPVQETPPTRKR